MQNKHDEGFSLVEILVAIVILAAFVVPTCSALVLANEMNNRTDDLMQAQLAVSSAVETLMAEGIPASKLADGITENVTNPQDSTKILYSFSTYSYQDIRFSAVTISVVEVVKEIGDQYVKMPWYDVKVTSNDELVEVTTSVRAVPNGGG